jgi:nitroimidazol reductase NimA-like FMN-containing flavoprotein (pyridoxamine 5'-phosphate oxidase superfamily)
MSQPAPTSPAPERARRLLAEMQNMVLATASADGVPWVTPLAFAAEGSVAVYWTSEPTARHSENLRANPRVAIVIYDDRAGQRVDGVYLEAHARELHERDEILHGIAVLAGLEQPDRWRIQGPQDVGPDGPWRLYRAELLSAEVRHTTEVNGRAVARREPAGLL